MISDNNAHFLHTHTSAFAKSGIIYTLMLKISIV